MPMATISAAIADPDMGQDRHREQADGQGGGKESR